MANVHDVARCLIQLAASGEEPDPLTHLRLQKLLYFVQGWSLAVRGKPMFDERIEAWKNGPVVPAVWETHRHWGRDLIVPTGEAATAAVPPGLLAADRGQDLDEEEIEFIASVWEEYKEHSASSLWILSHKTAPWLEARKGIPEDAASSELIPQESMERYFKSLMADE